MSSPTEWYRDNYLISTSPKLLQYFVLNNALEPASINKAFGTDALYWTRPIDESLLKKMLDKSMCFGVYELPASTSDIAGRGNPRQIGLARLITDEVSFAYLTDVYILDEYQSKGLGTWLIGCVDEVLSSWPELRRAILLTSHGNTFYTEKLRMKAFDQGKNGLQMLSRKGPGSPIQD